MHLVIITMVILCVYIIFSLLCAEHSCSDNYLNRPCLYHASHIISCPSLQYIQHRVINNYQYNTIKFIRCINNGCFYI